jgi:broad specificity phosphatase PhoE
MRRIVICLVWLAVLLAPALASAQKLAIVVRHAERADAGMASAETDPALSQIGEARAARLAAMLADAGVTGIYVTQYKRTQDTAKPLAARLNLKSEATPLAAEALVKRVKAEHPEGVVLIVGHSNTMPPIIKALGGPAVTIADQDYGDVFLIVPATGFMTRLHF